MPARIVAYSRVHLAEKDNRPERGRSILGDGELLRRAFAHNLERSPKRRVCIYRVGGVIQIGDHGATQRFRAITMAKTVEMTPFGPNMERQSCLKRFRTPLDVPGRYVIDFNLHSTTCQ